MSITSVKQVKESISAIIDLICSSDNTELSFCCIELIDSLLRLIEIENRGKKLKGNKSKGEVKNVV